MYIDGSCPGLGIGFKISDVSVGLSVIDPNEGCWITRFTFSLTHFIPRAGDKLKRPKIFSCVLFDDTEEKVAVRSEGKKGQDAIYEIALCKYLKPENELPIDSSIRFLCVEHTVWEFSKELWNLLKDEKCLKIILKGKSCVLPLLG